MKTLKSVVNQDERNAKIIGAIVTTLLSFAGIAAIAYRVIFFAPKVF